MQFETFLSALAAAITLLVPLTYAAPTPTEDLAPRACGTQGPNIIDLLKKSSPDTAFPGQRFTLQRTGGPPYTDTISAAITFNLIPAGATGCMLQIEIPPFATDNAIANGTATQADVSTTQPWSFNNEPTWNHPAAKIALVSTTIFPTQRSTTGYKTILTSNSCSPIMSYVFELSGWQQGAGNVDFVDTQGGKQGLVPIGFTMIYNC